MPSQTLEMKSAQPQHTLKIFGMSAAPHRDRVRSLSLKTLAICGFLLAALGFYEHGVAQNLGVSTLVSISAEGEMGNKGSFAPTVSSDGRFVLFVSQAENLVTENTDKGTGVFIRDRLLNQTLRVSNSAYEIQADPTPHSAVLSADGRFAVFGTETGDPTISQVDHPGINQIIIHDLLGAETVLVSISTSGEHKNTSSGHPSISGDGRRIVFSSSASNLETSKQNIEDGIYLYDQVTGHTSLASITIPGKPILETTSHPVISADGRIVAYRKGSQGDEIGFYNRVTTEAAFRNYALPGTSSKITGFDLSSNGNVFAYILESTYPDTLSRYGLYIHDRTKGEPYLFTKGFPSETMPASVSLSGDGRFVLLAFQSPGQGGKLLRYNLNSAEEILIDEGPIGSVSDLSYDGQSVAYTKDIEGISQVFVWEEYQVLIPTYILAGQVIDANGHPLSLVTLEDNQGNKTRTDGQGFFWINGIKPGDVTLYPFKEGFDFDPKIIQIKVNADIKNLKITYAHKETLKEARKDIGMPYSFNRGVDGPYHGYSAGYCTDLVLDAYTWGVDFNIQFALEQDFRAHPWNFYRWRDARDAHDMWRYFSYSGQVQPHSSPYQPGDIVFFDWSEDGEIDHVALVSEVNSRHRPLKMLDATGVINANPNGLAAELPWEDFHEQTVRGFARWSGKYEPVIPLTPAEQVFQMALGGAGMDIRLLDGDGYAISATDAQIPGGRFDYWWWEQSISILEPDLEKKYYLVSISNPGNQTLPFQFTIQWIKAGLVIDRIEEKGSLLAGEIRRFPLILALDTEGNVRLKLGNPNRRIEGKIQMRVY